MGLSNTTYLHQAAVDLNLEGSSVQGKLNASLRTLARVIGTHHEDRETFIVLGTDRSEPEKCIDANHTEDHIEISQA
jgi:hypothetical protein